MMAAIWRPFIQQLQGDTGTYTLNQNHPHLDDSSNLAALAHTCAIAQEEASTLLLQQIPADTNNIHT